MKKATDIEEQIRLLEARGMHFTDKKKAKEILLDIGYYRMGFYWFPYEATYPDRRKREHQFRENTTFDRVVTLYYFDHDLRAIIAPYLYRIEVNFRTYLTYTVSNRYKSDPTWFADPRIVSRDFTEYLPGCYKTIRKNEAIKHHHRKYRNDIYAPAWKAIEFMTFGDVLYLYTSLKDRRIKKEISAHYGIRNLDVFENYMGTLRVIRNLCAHGHHLYDLKLQKRIKKGPLKEMTDSRTHALSGGLMVLSYILGAISKNRVHDLYDKLHALISRQPNEDVREIIQDLRNHILEQRDRTFSE